MTQVVVHLVSGDLWGGAENQIWQLAARQQKRADLSVHVIILNDGQLYERLSEAGVDIFLLRESELGFTQLVRGAYSFIQRLSADGSKIVLHSHRRKENLIAVLVGFKLDVAVVRTLHGANEHSSSESSATKLVRLIERQLYRTRVAINVAVSSPLAAAIVSEGFKENRVRIIQNGIDFARLDAESRIGEKNRLDSYGAGSVSGKPFRIGIVGRLVPVKRQDLFIELASSLWNRGKRQFEYFIVGDGPLEGDLRALAQSSPARSKIHFTGFQKEVIPIIAALDVVVILSDHEGLPLTLLESIGLGTKVFGHDVGGVGEVLGSYPQLLLHEPLAEAASNALVRFEEGNDELERQYELLRDSVRQNLSIEKTEQEYFQLYADVSGFQEVQMSGSQ